MDPDMMMEMKLVRERDEVAVASISPSSMFSSTFSQKGRNNDTTGVRTSMPRCIPTVG